MPSIVDRVDSHLLMLYHYYLRDTFDFSGFSCVASIKSSKGYDQKMEVIVWYFQSTLLELSSLTEIRFEMCMDRIKWCLWWRELVRLKLFIADWLKKWK